MKKFYLLLALTLVTCTGVFAQAKKALMTVTIKTPSVQCDMCKDLLAKGEKPICVTSCPTRVLDFGKLEDLKKQYKGVNQVIGMPDPVTKAAFIITPHRNAVMDR